jgi:hypothetical protein
VSIYGSLAGVAAFIALLAAMLGLRILWYRCRRARARRPGKNGRDSQ